MKSVTEAAAGDQDTSCRRQASCVRMSELESRIMDVETAFLHGNLEEEIYMDCPNGLQGGSPSKCLRLNKTIYGLVQSGRMFFKKLIAKLKNIGFYQSDADPCLMIWKSELGPVYVAIYVDDCYCVGSAKAHGRRKSMEDECYASTTLCAVPFRRA